jgi:hypothetical protein
MAFPFAAKIAAQSGPQTEFLRSAADICIYGGAAGGGKTAGLILEPLRHVGRVANFKDQVLAPAIRNHGL